MENQVEQHENGHTNGGEAGVARIYEQTRRVRSDLEELVSAVVDARSEWEERLRTQLTERPYVGLAAAAGVGYVLGGGISPALLRTAVALGGRVAFAVLMRRFATTLTQTLTETVHERTV
jgi:ElaB/YqjD/DUF883 family membrane-anchored ribosome-binding protein